MTVLSASDARSLGEALHQDPVAHANNAATLLGCLKEPLQEPPLQPAARAAIQALKLFFAAQLDDGELRPAAAAAAAAAAASSSKRHKAEPATDAGQQQSAQALYSAWLSRQYAAFVSSLLRLLNDSQSASIQVAALAAAMECVRHEAGPATFSNRLFAQLLTVLLTSPNTQPETIALLVSRHLPCIDVRFFTLKAIARLAQLHAARAPPPAAAGSAAAAAAGHAGSDDDDDDEGPAAADGGRSAGDVARAMFDVLSALQPPRLPQKQQKQKDAKGGEQQQEAEEQEQQQSWCGAAEAGLVTAAADTVLSSKARRKRQQQQEAGGGAAEAAAVAWMNPKMQQRGFADAWLSFLRMDLPDDIYRKVLLQLNAAVLPWLPAPLLLADFLTASLDRGGLEGMLALHGIFTLVTRHGLEYPAFYCRLYGLITPAAFLHKHRVKFFQLADVFLASGMVPAYTAAAFAKRFARLALRAPPAGALLALGFIHNIIRRHPACMVLLHKPQQQPQPGAAPSPAAAAAAGDDVYSESQPDPAKSRAVESSLWELAALRNHYCPAVASMCSVLDKDLTDRVRTAELDVAPLLPGSYASLMAGELGRKLRGGRVPVAFYAAPPAGLFDAALVGDDLAGWDLAAPADGN